jgi:hypothetical protein
MELVDVNENQPVSPDETPDACFQRAYKSDDDHPFGECSGCERCDHINKFLEITSKPVDLEHIGTKAAETNEDGSVWFSEEPDIQRVLEEQDVLHMAKPSMQMHRAGERYFHLLDVICNEGVIRFHDGTTFTVKRVP